MSLCKTHKRKFDPSEGCELCREDKEMAGTLADETEYCYGCAQRLADCVCLDPATVMAATPTEKCVGRPGAPIWVDFDLAESGADRTVMFEAPTEKVWPTEIKGEFPLASVRAQCLQECIALTTGDRNKTYGPPEPNLTLQMELWTLYKRAAGDKHSMAHDAAMQHVFAKIARIASGPPLHKDNYLDLSNYSVIAYECDVEVLGVGS